MASHPIYQFYAELCDYKPKMWRRFQVANNVTMARLGYIVMTMFEMQASHLFCFDVPVEQNFKECVGEHIGNDVNDTVIKMFKKHPQKALLRIELISQESFCEFDGRVIDAVKIKLKNALDHEKECMTFTYDFGDNWQVSVVLEKIIEDKELQGKELPRVLEGEGFGIIEDCGGVGGLEDIAKAFKKKKGKQYEEYCDWLGVSDLDLHTFDIEDINFRLKKVPRIYADSYERELYPTKQSIDLLERKYKKA